jgi:hypothetical protein
MRIQVLMWALLCSAFVCSCGSEPEPVPALSGQALSLCADQLPNNQPIANPAGSAASFSTEGFIALDNAFHTPQGSNGRHCGTCHVPKDGWSIRPQTVEALFEETLGLHPLFNLIDANTPISDVSTVAARRQSYSMLLQGKFVRLRRPPATRDFDVVAADDPFNFGTTDNLLFFRRVPPTANFKSSTVMFDGANTVAGDLRAGLVRQARGNITGAQQGQPAPDSIINAIVDHELTLFHAQLIVPGVGRLDADGARGGPEAHAAEPLVAGRFDLFDAWANARKPRRAQIARGQEIFNGINRGSGRSCSGCHNARNSGQNVAGLLFDIGTSSPAQRKPDMAVYRFRKRDTTPPLEVESTDPGLGFVTGKFSDLNRFKVPTLRGLAARGPYFHNGIAATVSDVIRFYETVVGFDFTPAEKADLLAFLNAL